MSDLFIENAMPTIMQAIVSVLGIIITFAVTRLARYLVTQREALVKRIGVDQYNFYRSMAEAVYYGVEQQLSKSPGAWKKAEFDKRLLAKIPGLTQGEIDHFREAVVGKIKASVAEILGPYNHSVMNRTPADSCSKSVTLEDTHNVITRMKEGKVVDIVIEPMIGRIKLKPDYEKEYHREYLETKIEYNLYDDSSDDDE